MSLLNIDASSSKVFDKVKEKRSLRPPRRTSFSQFRLSSLQNTIDRRGEPGPVLGLRGELFFSGTGQLVEFSLSVIVRASPFRFDEALLFQPVERRVKRPLVYYQNDFADPLKT